MAEENEKKGRTVLGYARPFISDQTDTIIESFFETPFGEQLIQLNKQSKGLLRIAIGTVAGALGDIGKGKWGRDIGILVDDVAGKFMHNLHKGSPKKAKQIEEQKFRETLREVMEDVLSSHGVTQSTAVDTKITNPLPAPKLKQIDKSGRKGKKASNDIADFMQKRINKINRHGRRLQRQHKKRQPKGFRRILGIVW